jgi:ketosteroid isomerase-like protein
MDSIDVVNTRFAASEAGQISKFADFLSEDFVFAGSVSEPVGKREFVSLMTAMVAGVPTGDSMGRILNRLATK